MRLLITRPEPDATIMAAALEAKGHTTLIAPMLDIDFADVEPIDVSDAQAVIATSRNAIRGLLAQPHVLDDVRARSLPLLAVGPGTEAAARAAGIGQSVTGAGAARDLVEVVRERLDPAAGHVVHLAGDALAFDLAAALQALGFQVRTPVVYRARAARCLTPAAAVAIAEGALDAVLLMSPRSAATLQDLLAAEGLTEAGRRLLYLCLSEQVAALARKHGAACLVALKPNSEEMLALVEWAATHSGRQRDCST